MTGYRRLISVTSVASVSLLCASMLHADGMASAWSGAGEAVASDQEPTPAPPPPMALPMDPMQPISPPQTVGPPMGSVGMFPRAPVPQGPAPWDSNEPRPNLWEDQPQRNQLQNNRSANNRWQNNQWPADQRQTNQWQGNPMYQNSGNGRPVNPWRGSPTYQNYTNGSQANQNGQADENSNQYNKGNEGDAGPADGYGDCDGYGPCQNCWGCWPHIYAEVGAIFLWRNNTVRVRSVANSIDPAGSVLDTRSADFDTGIGPRIVLGLRPCDCVAWEMTYFSALDFSGQADVTSFGNLEGPGEFPQLQGWSAVDAMRLDYTSELHNVEINYVYSWCRWSVLAGFRYVRLTDDLGIRAVTDSTFTSNDNYRVHSENNLCGVQLGVRYHICCDRFFGEITGKAGFYGNDDSQSQFLTAAGGTELVRHSTSYDSTTAFVGDMHIAGGFRLTCVWDFRVAYNLMWIQQVALAGDQLDFNLGSSAGVGVRDNGDVFLHGISVGFEGHW